MPPIRSVPLLFAVCSLGTGLGAAVAPPTEFVGGTADDQAFARAASGLKPGEALGEDRLQASLEAIRTTDRFRKVEGSAARIVLDPWPALEGVEWTGNAPSDLRKGLLPSLRRGRRPGALRLEVMRAQAQERLVALGYPKARVKMVRQAEDTRLVVDVDTGPPNLILKVELVGRTGPFTPEALIRQAKVIPGRSLWSRELELDCLRRLRKALVKKHLYEARVDLDWDQDGMLRITLDAGPRVSLRTEGKGLGWLTSLKDLVPLARSDRYSAELLDEGERRIVRLLRSRGHLDPQVSHRREVVKTGPQGPEEVVVTYVLAPGPVSKVGRLVFEGNRALSTRDLEKAADLSGWPLTPKARPETMDAVESRIQALYQSQGYTEVRIRRTVAKRGGRADLTFQIREGQRMLVNWVSLDLPPGGFGDPWGLGECLALVLSEKITPGAPQGEARVYRSDRPWMADVEGRLVSEEKGGRLRLTLRLNRAIPLIKADWYRAFTAVRQQRLASLGVVRPVVRSRIVEEGGLRGIAFEIPDQALEKVDRVVVQGSERTRAEAVLREVHLEPGTPLDQDKLSRAQGRLGTLGAFQRVDITSLAETGGEAGPPVPWKAGDLLVRTEERSPWVVTNSLGYDTTQGYYLGTGVQRQNVGGMGRTLDFNIRAGDGTINSKTLRDAFPTGQYTRSLDSYSVAYTDPWFAPGRLGRLLPERTAFRLEGAYIQEQHSVYQVHRRRVQTALRWPVFSAINFEAGYRFERVEVSSNVTPTISQEDLARIARSPSHSVISAPYLQAVRDTRDNAFDPTSGTYSVVRFEAASQFFLTSPNSSFLKLDLRNQWTWPLGYRAGAGVVALGVRMGLARPTASTSEDLPLSERFFAGGSGSMRGVKPDSLGPVGRIPLFDTYLDENGHQVSKPRTVVDKDGNTVAVTQQVPLGGQALVLVSLEYRFPVAGQSVWGELFVDSGQVYQRLHNVSLPDENGVMTFYPVQRPPLRTALGLGLIFKVGVPLKLEYAADVNRILGRSRSEADRETQLAHVLISMGFQF